MVEHDRLDALRSSVARLQRLTAALSETELTRGAYPTEWRIADVLSHLGSGAVITRRRLGDALAGTDTPEDFAPGVWDEWNAKAPVAQRDDALAADAALMADLDAVTDEQRTAFASAMGPMTLTFDEFVGMRLNEHAFHTWDIDVVADPAATLPPDVTAPIVDNLELIARFTAKPTGDTAALTVATTDPDRRFAVDVTPEAVTFAPWADTSPPTLQLTSEAFARLVYGRLDPDHTPSGDHGPALDLLRQVFPGP